MLAFRSITLVTLTLSLAACGNSQMKKDPAFFTSGSQQADQRAEQRMAQSGQLKGSQRTASGASAPAPKTLYDRLGADPGLAAIADDFVPRLIADPRVNFDRVGVTHGGFLGMHKKSSEWHPTAADITTFKKHLVEFIAVAAGGPSHYTGKDMKSAHAGMNISNTEFDAGVGDLKATLDKLGIATADQKELLAIAESTRPQIVEVR